MKAICMETFAVGLVERRGCRNETTSRRYAGRGWRDAIACAWNGNDLLLSDCICRETNGPGTFNVRFLDSGVNAAGDGVMLGTCCARLDCLDERVFTSGCFMSGLSSVTAFEYVLAIVQGG